MINCFVAQCVKTYCLIVAYFLVLAIGFSTLAVKNCYAGRFAENFYRFQADLNIMHNCQKQSTTTGQQKDTTKGNKPTSSYTRLQKI